MISSIVCWGKSKLGKCHLFGLDATENMDINIAKISKRNIALLQYRLNKCIEKNCIEEVLKFYGDYIDKNYLKGILTRQEMLEEEMQIQYEYEVASCGSVCEIGEEDLNKINEEINERMKRYNSDLTVVKKVQNYCKGISFKNHNRESVFFKFGRDRNQDLVALYFNIDSFILNDRYSPVEPAFVFSGEGEYPFHQHTVLHLKREGDYAHVIIWGFQSNNRKKGHGTFLVRNLDEMIRVINEKIVLINKEDRECKNNRGRIEVVRAEVVPGNIPYNKLVTFYNSNGLPTIARMTDGHGVIIEIYKTID